MKKIILSFFLILNITSYSQISLDFQNTILQLYPFKLSNSVTKYVDLSDTQIFQNYQVFFYNLDGTFYKTIQIPHDQDPESGITQIGAYSSNLFDTDPSNIEYLVQYMWDSCNNCNQYYIHVKVIREDGTVLLDEMNAGNMSIYNTEEGTKLLMNYRYANYTYYRTKVFSLPGELPTLIEDEITSDNLYPVLYPNPNNGSFYVEFKSGEGEFSTIDLYSISGKLLNSYRSNTKTAFISNSDLSNGIYIINSKSKGISRNNKLIIEK